MKKRIGLWIIHFEFFMKHSENIFLKNIHMGSRLFWGSVEHLKNPSLRKMREYYDKYYVANNMYLIIAGDFNKREVKRLIKEKFKKIKKGRNIEPIDIVEAPLKERNC